MTDLPFPGIPFTTTTTTEEPTTSTTTEADVEELTTTLAYCQEVPKIANGFVYLASSFQTRRPGDWVTYECNQGYKMTGKFIVKCLENGTWEDLPSCTKDGAGPAPQLLPGGIDPAEASSLNELGMNYFKQVYHFQNE